MSGSFTVSGMEDLGRCMGRLKTLNVPIQRATRRAGKLWVDQIRAGMTAAGSPSSPGDYPGVRSGALRGSIQYFVIGNDELHVGTNVHYARYLEEGTSRMASRPIIGNKLELSGLLETFRHILITEINIHLMR